MKRTLLLLALLCYTVTDKVAAQVLKLVSKVALSDTMNKEDVAYGVGDDGIYNFNEPVVTVNIPDNVKYPCRNLADFNLQTAFVFDTSQEKGLEVSYQFKLAASSVRPAFKVTTLSLFNSYRKSLQTWNNNSRVRELSILVNKKPVAQVALKDTYKGQFIDLKKLKIVAWFGKTLEITLRFNGFYPGDKYVNDIAVSEIIFDGERLVN